MGVSRCIESEAHVCSDPEESFAALAESDFQLSRQDEDVSQRVSAGPGRRARVLDGPRLTGNGKDGLVPVEAWSDDLPRWQELAGPTGYPRQVDVWRKLATRKHELYRKMSSYYPLICCYLTSGS